MIAPDVGFVAVYRSYWRPTCVERAFVLQAVGIASEIVPDVRGWALVVADREADAAASQLRRYELENPPRRAPTELEPPQRGAWLGSAAYAVVMLAVAFLAGTNAFDADWLDAGALVSAAVRGGEYWRIVTALTLHLDVGHLLANLGFGIVFGFLAGQVLGPGLAWGSILLAASAANLLNAFIEPDVHASVGASTAVFATLGLLAAYEWRRRASAPERSARRWAPIVAGVFLLAFMGVGGENTDVLAHATGFAMGALAGVVHTIWRAPRGTAAQLAVGFVALAATTIAWALALSRV